MQYIMYYNRVGKKLCPKPQMVPDDIISFGLVEVKGLFINSEGFI